MTVLYRENGKQACVIWEWMLDMQGLVQGASWGGLIQGSLQALRISKHMAMWVPRQDMLEDMCQGFM